MEIQNFGSVCQEIPSNKNGFFLLMITMSLYIFWISSSLRNILRDFKDSLKFLEKSLKFQTNQPLPWYATPLKYVPSSLPWNSRFFKINLIFPLKFFGYPQPWKPLKLFEQVPLTLNEPWTSRSISRNLEIQGCDSPH